MKNKEDILRYTLRTDRDLFRKFKYVASYDGRSANKDIEQYMKKRVKSFEEKHGEIPLNDELK